MMRSSTLLLLLTAAQRVSSQTSGSCDLNCHPGSSCVQGNADFSSHPKDINGVAFDFLQETSKNGWYCDCPMNMTGLRCNRPYVECDGNDHVCYHGGKCIDGIEDAVAEDQLFCDCDGANHMGVPYVGKYCEVEGAVECGDSQEFCTHGGTCADGFETMAHPCNCKTGHRGPHCEFDTGFVPECTLECQNGGACMLGIKDYDTALMAEFWAVHDGKFQYCECPEGWFGLNCEIQGEKCGTDLCFNGAKCLQTEHSDGEVEYTCDCSTANNGQTSYSGEFCENEASSFCSKDATQNGQLFCVNGGVCKEDEEEGCECPEGFHGPICEYRDAQTVDQCRLQCQNGGRCRSGQKDNKLFQQFGEELKRYNETHKLWEHCVCPEGYFGIQCEHELEICPGGEHVCLHGSKCVAQDETNSETSSSCDCDEAFNGNTQFAGKFCQYTSTDVCTKNGKPGTGKASFAFCVNNGKCKDLVDANEPHPGCECTNGFHGPHCEFLNQPAATTEDDKAVSQSEGLIIGLASALLVLVALIFGGLLKKYAESGTEHTGKDDIPTDIDTHGGTSGMVTEEETVDMQSPRIPLEEKELHTVEII